MGYQETRPRCPVAAEYKSPGPAYKLPSLIGKEGHDPQSVYKATPAYSFGWRVAGSKYEASPGPKYLPNLNYTRFGQDYSPHCSIQPRPKELESPQVPGPNKYNVRDVLLSQSPRAPSYSMAVKKGERKVDKKPGPNAYKLPSLIGKTSESTHAQAPSYTMPRSSLDGGLNQTMPPGLYQVNSTDSYKRKAPQYSITGRTPVVPDHTLKPGPGAHDPKLSWDAPSYTFGTRHSEYEAVLIAKRCKP